MSVVVKIPACRQAGQTMVEVLIAVSLVALVLVGLVAGATVSLRSARVSRERNVAVGLAQKELEEARIERDQDPVTFFADEGQTGPTEVPAAGGNPAYQVTVTKTLTGNQMNVVALVTWSDANQDFSVTESTYLYRWQ